MNEPKDHTALVDSLIKNTTIQESSLTLLGLRVSSLGFRVLNNYQLQAFFEISVSGESSLKKNAYYTPGVSLYDENGNILSTEKARLTSEGFLGFESYIFGFYIDGIALKAKRAKFFIS